MTLGGSVRRSLSCFYSAVILMKCHMHNICGHHEGGLLCACVMHVVQRMCVGVRKKDSISSLNLNNPHWITVL